MMKIFKLTLLMSFFVSIAWGGETKVVDLGDGEKFITYQPTQEELKKYKEERKRLLNRPSYDILIDNSIPASEYNLDELSVDNRKALLTMLGRMRGSDDAGGSSINPVSTEALILAETVQPIENPLFRPVIAYKTEPMDIDQRDRWLITIALTEKALTMRQLNTILQLLTDSNSDTAEAGIEKIHKFSRILIGRSIRGNISQMRIDSFGFDNFHKKYSYQIETSIIQSAHRRIRRNLVKNRSKMITLISKISTSSQFPENVAKAERSLSGISNTDQ